ncbi:DUF7286 family protein [Natronorubrum sulfidifaciens]|uniref:Uncharacterized protein n=1 Tax=Natronorubrum sulfidifaciens JCM 14089 TaxID=1230460 RepID=L9WFZ9_9EURY|nr:hypothetical protein [Natronorubrum sulfidifaciens]ELY48201.1 hypothetical protein C495_01965 [Natronorubrum sulfidifaciens JCM 14089]
MRRTRPHTVSIADDDRARVPFAVIGVLLLMSSVLIVATLQTRTAPEIDRSTELAIDRAEAYAISELRHVTVRTTDEVVRSPVTTVNSDLDGVLDDETALEDQTRITILAEATATLDGRQQHVGQGQTVEVSLPAVDDWTDTDDLEAALEHVTLEEDDGIMDVTVEDVEFTVRDEDGTIETVVSRDISVSVGTTMMALHERVDAYETHLNTGMLEGVDQREGYGYDLAKRLWPLVWGKAYYDRLFGDPADRAFENVTPNDHTEVMANDARLAAQQEVFGTQDEYGNRVMAGPVVCMAYDLSDSALDLGETYDFDAIADDLHPDENVSTVDELCAAGVISPDGDLPDMPTVEEIVLGMLENVDKNGTTQGHPFADMAMYEMEAGLGQDVLESEMRTALNETDRFNEAYLEDYYGDSERVEFDQDADPDALEDIQGNLGSLRDEAIQEIDNTDSVIDDVYTVNGKLGTVKNTPSMDGLRHPLPPLPEEYDASNHTEVDRVYLTTNTDVEGSIDKVTEDSSRSGLEQSLVSVDVEVEMRYETYRAWNNTTTNSSVDVWEHDNRYTDFTASFELDGEFAPGLETDPNSIEHVLDQGGSPDPYLGGPTNWEDAADEVTRAFFGQDFDSDSEFERWLSGRVNNIESRNDFRDAINYDSSFDEDIQLSPRNEGMLHTYIVWEDLFEIHNETVTEIEPVEAEVMEMLTADESPIREMDESIAEMEAKHVDGRDDFENAPDVARMEARKVYFDNMYKYVDKLASEHERMTTGGGNLIDSLLGGFLDSVNEIISGPMNLVDEMLGAGEELLQDEDDPEIDTPDVLNDVHVTVDGSPTYHTSQVAVNQTEVPAVRAAGDGPLEIDDEMNFAPMGAGYENEIGHPGFPLIPWPPLFYLQVDAWQIELEGEYARFEVEATSGDPSVTDSTTYVREDKAVTLETPDGDELGLGSTDPISYENTQTILAVVPAPQFLPQGAPGVGDNQHGGNAPGEMCSPFWDDTGPDAGVNSTQPSRESCL